MTEKEHLPSSLIAAKVNFALDLYGEDTIIRAYQKQDRGEELDAEEAAAIQAIERAGQLELLIKAPKPQDK